jgi:phenylacetic acid degradation protein
MARYEFNGKKPVVGSGSWVHETAQLIGDVEIGENCFIGPGASLRGDFGSIHVGDNSNVQDNCVLHARPGLKCSVGKNTIVGHGAILHCCEIGDNSLIGMGSIVSDFAVIGEGCLVAEGSLVKAKTKIEPGMLVSGSPAVVKGPLKDQQMMMLKAGVFRYVELAGQLLKTAKKID